MGYITQVVSYVEQKLTYFQNSRNGLKIKINYNLL